MGIQLVEPSTAINMIGPYLAANVTCPECNMENVLARIEGPTSPVKAISICSHLRAHVIDDEGASKFEFEVGGHDHY